MTKIKRKIKSPAQIKRRATIIAKTWLSELEAQVERGREDAKAANEAKDRAYQATGYVPVKVRREAAE